MVITRRRVVRNKLRRNVECIPVTKKDPETTVGMCIDLLNQSAVNRVKMRAPRSVLIFVTCFFVIWVGSGRFDNVFISPELPRRIDPEKSPAFLVLIDVQLHGIGSQGKKTLSTDKSWQLVSMLCVISCRHFLCRTLELSHRRAEATE